MTVVKHNKKLHGNDYEWQRACDYKYYVTIEDSFVAASNDLEELKAWVVGTKRFKKWERERMGVIEQVRYPGEVHPDLLAAWGYENGAWFEVDKELLT